MMFGAELTMITQYPQLIYLLWIVKSVWNYLRGDEIIKLTIIHGVQVYRSNVTGLQGNEMGDGLAIQTTPALETLNSHQVVRIAEAIKHAVEGLLLEVE